MTTVQNRLRLMALLAAVALPVSLSVAQQPTKDAAPVQATPAGTAKIPAAPQGEVKPAPAPMPVPQAPSALPEALKLDHNKFDWGDITDTEPVEHTFGFTNTSDKEITIAVAASCGCTVPTLEKTTYKAGETGKVTARFDPHNRQGPQTKTLTFTVTQPQGVFAQQMATLTANVKALVTFDPPKMFLSEVDHQAGQTTKLTITGRKPDFKVESVTPNSEFVKAKIGDPTTSEVNGEKLTQIPVEIQVGKGAPIGTLQAQLDIKTNDERAKMGPYFLGADVVGDVKATPTQVILRTNDPSTPFTTQVRLDSRSGSEFNILSLETDARKEMQVVVDAQKATDGHYYMITLSGVTPSEGGMVQHYLTVSTDARGGETLRIPFTAVIRKAMPNAPTMAPGVQPMPAVMPAGKPSPAPAKGEAPNHK